VKPLVKKIDRVLIAEVRMCLHEQEKDRERQLMALPPHLVAMSVVGMVCMTKPAKAHGLVKEKYVNNP
jgi:hypothetical protein